MQARGKNILLRFRTITSSCYRDGVGCTFLRIRGLLRSAHYTIAVYDVTSRKTFEVPERWCADREKNTTMPVVKMFIGNKVDKE